MFRFLSTLLLVSAALDAAWGESGTTLRSHRAVYDVTLADVSDRSGIRSIDGRIVYEFKGSQCEGYSTRYRFVTRVQTARKSFVSDDRTTTFESSDGQDFNFVSQNYLNGQLERDVRGSAKRGADGIAVNLTKPEEGVLELPEAVFSTTHLLRIIEAAQAGQTIVETTLFDGSGDADSVTETLAVIGKRQEITAPAEGEGAGVAGTLDGTSAWPASVSYFDEGTLEGGGERTPIYQVSFKVYPSGVTRDLTMRFRDYTLRGALQTIEFLPQGEC